MLPPVEEPMDDDDRVDGALEPRPTDRTLLLNRGYEPLRVISWQRALCLSVCGKVEVVEVYGRFAHSVHLALPLPAVVRLHRYVHHRPVGPRFSRRNVFLRDDFTCQYCGERGSEDRLTFDHVVPRVLGGRTDWSNIVTCCEPCNHRKGARSVAAAGMRLRTPPRKPMLLPLSREHVPLSDPPSQWRLYLRAA
jgi:5-methylcytosine-specific restriction endonuclease McrA